MAENRKTPSDQRNPSTPLTGYKQEGKSLTPPFATLNMQTRSWINERLPDMLWAALIIDHHGRLTALGIFRRVLKSIEGEKEITGITLTDIATLSDGLRQELLSRIVVLTGTDALRPLLLFPDLPAHDDWARAMGNQKATDEDVRHLADAISAVLFHQSQEATDCRWVKLMGTILAGKIKFTTNQGEMLDEILQYPDKGDQRKVRPSIRSMEIGTDIPVKASPWANKFWDYCYERTSCIPEINEGSQTEIKRKQNSIAKDKRHYHEVTPAVRDALITHFFETSKTTMVDARHESIFGISLYAVDAFIENILLLTASTINGRVTARIILEAYLTLAYLLHKENAGEALWDTYRNYGTGQISLIERKYEDQGYNTAMVDLKKMDAIANEDKWSEFVPINLGHWDTSNLRKISIEIGEKELYDKYYDYPSGYIHAAWGAVREASMQSCYNPLHRLHRIPGFGLAVLPNVNEDCRVFINKILGLLDKAYPEFKERIPAPPGNGTMSDEEMRTPST